MRATTRYLNRRTHVALGAMILATAAGTAMAADFTLKFGVATRNEPMHEYMKLFEPCVESASKQRIDVQLFPGGQLGGVSRMIEGLQLGTLEGVFIAAQHMKGVEKRYGVVDAPGLFTSFDHANKVYWDPRFREPFLNAGKAKGVVGVGIFAYGPSSYATKTPVTKLADFKGMKFRILATQVEQRIVDSFGAAGLQVDPGDWVPALQRGQLDGIRSNIVVARVLKVNTVAKHTTMTNEAMIPVVGYLSTKFLDRLPADLRDAVFACGKQVERESSKIAMDFDDKAQQAWKAEGGELHTLAPADQATLMANAQKIGEDLFSADPDLKDLYGTMVKLAAEHADKK
jgi:TRAP-type C4-dicarboxylate transport system substrate-binding protein